MLVASNSVDVVVVDSVAALVPRAEVEGEIGFQAEVTIDELVEIGDGLREILGRFK